jgi:hypothetical protein
MAGQSPTGVPPGTQTANSKALTQLDDRLTKLSDLDNQVDAKLSDPAYSTPQQQQSLQQAKKDIEDAQEALQKEKDIRESLDQDLSPPADPDAAKNDLAALNEHRKNTYPQFYKQGAKVGNPCMPCLQKEINQVKPALTPQNDAQAADAITGIYEGGRPDYCALADSPTDLGKLSYGKHQASETSGNLKRMLDQYSNSTDPAPDPDIKSALDDQLGNFNDAGNSYTGTPEQRAEFKKLLRKACKDPAMQKAQDDFFQQQFWDPAKAKADQYGVTSNLGKAIYYDMQIQGPGLIDGFSKRALKKWSQENGVDPPATACAPQDPNGPPEKDFLYLVDEQRRTTMQNSSNPDYRKTTYRPDGFDRLLDDDNMDLSKDFVLVGQPVKGVPPPPPPAPPPADSGTPASPDD